MKIVRTKIELQATIELLKKERPSNKVGFVPTMGALHEGHASLVKMARQLSDIVVVSVFVNPTQFNNHDDLKRYPRTFEADVHLLENEGADVLFYPEVEAVYSEGIPEIKIELNGLDEVMEGAFRPGHFDGVIMVVSRLFDLVKPDIAFFGRKDFQQLAIIQRMTAELNLPIEIFPVPIFRSPKGLALSSRNSLLSESEKEDALIIIDTLKFGYNLALTEKNAEKVKQKMIQFFSKGKLDLEYLSLVDSLNLKEAVVINQNTTVCLAAYCGKVRLIDNCQLS